VRSGPTRTGAQIHTTSAPPVRHDVSGAPLKVLPRGIDLTAELSATKRLSSEHAGRMAGSALGDPRFGLSLRWSPFAQWTYALKLCIRDWKR
jgi:hypothetical protein